MKKLSLLLLLGVLAACAATPQKCINYLECPDGMSDCREQAQETCPQGYQILKDTDVGPDFSDFAKQHFEGARSGVPHIVVTCN